jgi:LysR family transcriptional regulator for bpeEF and oprC
VPFTKLASSDARKTIAPDFLRLAYAAHRHLAGQVGKQARLFLSYPDILLDVGVSDRPTDLVSEGVDCAIRGGALADSTLVARHIADLRYVTCASPAYLARHGRPSHPEQLDGPAHGVLHYFSSLTARPFPLHFERGPEALAIHGNPAVAVNESTAHLTALLAGLGIGQTFSFMAQPYVARGALVPVLTEWTRQSHPLHVLYPANRYLNAKVRVFVDWVVDLFDDFTRQDGNQTPPPSGQTRFATSR